MSSSLHLRVAGAAATVALLASAHAFAQDPPRLARERHACAVVMGLHHPGSLYDSCIRTLEQSLSGFDRQRSLAAARGACADRGLNPGTRGFALCVETATRTPSVVDVAGLPAE